MLYLLLKKIVKFVQEFFFFFTINIAVLTCHTVLYMYGLISVLLFYQNCKKKNVQYI